MLDVKTGSYGFLKKIGVPESLVQGLSAKGYKISVGHKSLAIFGANGDLASTVYLGNTASDLVKGSVSPVEDAQKVASAIVMLLSWVAVPGGGEPKPAASISEKIIGVSPAPSKAPVDGVIALRDATALYQCVKGSSKGSVYVTVALNATVKVAARVMEQGLAVRVECSDETLSALESALAGVGIAVKGDYASGHFSCTNVSPARVLGAILLDSGIKFDTPLPDVSKVAALCSK